MKQVLIYSIVYLELKFWSFSKLYYLTQLLRSNLPLIYVIPAIRLKFIKDKISVILCFLATYMLKSNLDDKPNVFVFYQCIE